LSSVLVLWLATAVPLVAAVGPYGPDYHHQLHSSQPLSHPSLYFPSYSRHLNSHHHQPSYYGSSSPHLYHPDSSFYGHKHLATGNGFASRHGPGYLGNGGIGIQQTGETLANIYGQRPISSYIPSGLPTSFGSPSPYLAADPSLLGHPQP